MGYTNYLKDLLRPMGIYDLTDGGGAAELCALGNALDEVFAAVSMSERECIVPTAEERGLSAYEEILPGLEYSGTADERRMRIMALLQVDDMSFTEAALDKVLAAWGTGMTINDTAEWYTVTIRLPALIRGMADDAERWCRQIELILPCHIDVRFKYNFPTWDEIERAYPTWDDISSKTLSDLECYFQQG